MPSSFCSDLILFAYSSMSSVSPFTFAILYAVQDFLRAAHVCPIECDVETTPKSLPRFFLSNSCGPLEILTRGAQLISNGSGSPWMLYTLRQLSSVYGNPAITITLPVM